MWSYEIIFHHPDYSKRKTKNAIPMTEVSESIVADSAEQVLNYVLDQLKTHLEYEFVGIIRRNPILTILKDND